MRVCDSPAKVAYYHKNDAYCSFAKWKKALCM